MKTFTYRALNQEGRVVEDFLEAQTRHAALTTLLGRGWTPLLLDEAAAAAAAAAAGQESSEARRVAARDVEAFTRQLSSLLSAGVPLAPALHRLAVESGRPAAAQTWRALHDLVSDGTSLADAMGHFPGAFSSVYRAMVRAGETGGFLDLVLSQIADFQSRDRELRSNVVSALIYPLILALLCVAVVMFLMAFFIPRFQLIFADFGTALPALTRLVIALSRQAKRWLLPLAAMVVVIGVLLRQQLDSDAGQRKYQAFILRLPVIGRLRARFAMTRFCGMLGTLIHAGVPLVNALKVAREAIGNVILSDAVTESLIRVQQGSSLAEGLKTCPRLFPGSILEMISVAEESGRMDAELVRIAERSEKDLDRDLKRAVALAEPLMLFVMAAVIGLIVVAMILPIFSLQDYIN